ncbi:MAG: acetolactate synthase small subunit [Acidobacteria bacterium]|nr:acetolactate synthase small subunit [Acidobacteriota bacterium]MCI0717604.1 acetolactate synthase small subunit [Acidobacteriota bacterium]
MRHLISVWIANRPGELARVAGMFSARGFNIESLTVAETRDRSVSCLTVVADGDNRRISQLAQQLGRLVRVFRVASLTERPRLERELALIRLRPDPGFSAKDLQEILSSVKAQVIDSGPEGFAIEASGTSQELSSLFSQLSGVGSIEIARSGTVALEWNRTGEWK